MMKTILNNTSYQQILTFLADMPEKTFYDSEVAKEAGLSVGATNQALKALAKEGYIKQETKGRMKFYSADLSNAIVRQFKVLINVLIIENLIKNLKEVSNKIVLFGSSATGTNIKESDIDLFILANQPKKVLDIINNHPLAEKIQAVIKKPADYLTLKKKDPIFYEEVSKGFLIWEKK